jgi:hypothetical protein
VTRVPRAASKGGVGWNAPTWERLVEPYHANLSSDEALARVLLPEKSLYSTGVGFGAWLKLRGSSRHFLVCR